MPLLKSWVESANSADCPFPLNNLPYGAYVPEGDDLPRCCVAIGDQLFDAFEAELDDLIALGGLPVAVMGDWNGLMMRGPAHWAKFRARMIEILREGSPDRPKAEKYLVPLEGAQLVMPLHVSEYTDFYAGRNHAFNVGSMFRDPENALPPNWLHIPIGYNGRASSVVVSGTDVRRPWGQVKSPDYDVPAFRPSRRFDLELEMGAIVGQASTGPLSVAEAQANLFGFVLLNDWSARDIQAWEYQPLGPFQSKATATSISPWIVTAAALEPFRRDGPVRDVPLLPHLVDDGPMFYDVDLSVTLAPEGQAATTISRTNYTEMYYCAAQQLAHHTTSGCPMRVGDLLGSGTISGPEKGNRGSLLELSWGGKEPLVLDTGETRSFLEDGDTLTLSGVAQGDGYTIGFGACTGTILPALDDPYER